MSFEFDNAVNPVPLGDGLYDTPVEDRWDINGNANGGYLAALVANAMRAETGRAHPLSVTVHYLSPSPAGPAQTRTEEIKSGRRMATATGSLVRDGRELVRAIGVFGDIDATVGPQSDTVPKLVLPPFDECPVREAPVGVKPGLSSRLDIRMHEDDIGFATGNPPGRAEVRGWFTFKDGRPVDTLALLLAADAYAPCIFNLNGMTGWVPTIEYTVHVRGVPAPGPVAAQFTSTVVQGGFWEENGVIWDSTGRVVAMSRQLALVPMAPPQ